LNFTDNANLKTTGGDSDFFLSAVSNNKIEQGSKTFGFRLSYFKYEKETANDLLGWKLSAQMQPFSDSQWSFLADFFGQRYSQGAPGTTDLSYDNTGVDLQLLRKVSLGSKTTIEFGPGFQLRDFSGIDSRTDNTFFGAVSLNRDMNSLLFFGAKTEVGFVSSSQKEYSKNYLEIEGWINYQLRKQWSWDNDVLLRYSNFPNRTVSQPTATTKHRGIAITSTGQETESYNLFLLTSEVRNSLRENLSVAFALTRASQNSRSQLQDYSETQISARGIATF
jgi:hypothetical protein